MTWYLFKKYLFSSNSSSLVRTIARICLIGVAVGVMAMVVVISVMNGFGGGIEKRLLNVEPHLVVVSNDESKVKKLFKVLEPFKKDGQVLMNERYETHDVILRTVDSIYGGAVARGITKDSLKFIFDHVDQGDSEIILPLAKDEVVVGVDLARSMGIFENDEVVIVSPEALLLPEGEPVDFEKVTVKGLLRSNIPEVDGHVIFYNLGQTLGKVSKNATLEKGVEIRLNDSGSFSKIENKIEAQSIDVSSWRERNSALFYSLKMEKFLMGLFFGITLIIATFSIVTVLIMLGTQKRKDFGILMALGMTPGRVQRIFTGLGLMLSFSGILGGLLLGTLICLFGDKISFIELPDIYYDTRIPFKFEIWIVPVILIIGGFASLLSAWIPARINARLTPIEALRPPT